MLGILVLGAIVRLSWVLRYDFPLNDGGLFFLMTKELIQNHWQLPSFTSYNKLNIPFAYAPLGFYLSGFISVITSCDLLTVFRFLPTVISICTLLAFIFFARKNLIDSFAWVPASVAFALIPRSFEWLIMGGGTPRGLGLLFAILTFIVVFDASEKTLKNQKRVIFLSSLFFACGLASHLETGLFIFWSSGLIFYSRSNSVQRSIFFLCFLLFFGALFSSPWWGQVLALHGITPYINAIQTSSPYQPTRNLFSFVSSIYITFQEERNPIILGAICCGIFSSYLGKQWYLTVWWVLCFFIDLRFAATCSTIPGALLIGCAVKEAYQKIPQLNYRFAFRVTTFVCVSFSLASLWTSTDKGYHGNALSSLSVQDRLLFEKIKNTTPQNSSFILITDKPWEIDKFSEWFPVLAERQSVFTPQGQEWLSSEFSEVILDYRTLQQSWRTGLASTLDTFYDKAPTGPTYLLLRYTENNNFDALENDLRKDRHYTLALEGATYSLFKYSYSSL